MHQQTRVTRFSHIIYGNLQLLLRDYEGFPVSIPVSFTDIMKNMHAQFLWGSLIKSLSQDVRVCC